MLRAPSLQRTTIVCYSRDPALNLPDAPERATGDAGADALAAAAWKEWDRRIAQARETGTWDGLIRDGEKPTEFHLVPMSSRTFRALLDAAGAGRIGDAALTALAFRACVRAVDGFGDFKVETERDRDWGVLAKDAITDALDAISPAIVGELGGICWERAVRPSPK